MNDLTLGELFEMAGCPIVIPESEKKKLKRPDPPLKIKAIYAESVDPEVEWRAGYETVRALFSAMEDKAKRMFELYEKGEIQLPQLPKGMQWDSKLLYEIFQQNFFTKMTEKTGEDYLRYAPFPSSRTKKTRKKT